MEERTRTEQNGVGSSKVRAGSSITDELREWMRVVLTDDDPAHAIADRIDEQHRRGIATAQYIGYNEGEDAAMRDGWVKLPVDADGVPICIGDELDVGFVARIVITDDEWPPYLYAYKETPHILSQHFCSEVSHYHAPTVEDVLRECIANVCRSNAELHDQGCPPLTTEDIDEELDEFINEYATRLRLAGEAE